MREAYDEKGNNTVLYKEKKKRAYRFRRAKTSAKWYKVIQESLAKSGGNFRLIKNLSGKGKLWVEKEQLAQLKSKKPEIIDTIENTEYIWRDYYNKHFDKIPPDKLPQKLGDDLDTEYVDMDIECATEVVIPSEVIGICLNKAKLNTAAGHSKIP